MSRKSKGMPKTVDRLEMDALLYGVKRSLAYQGEQERAILDNMGSIMLQYLIDAKRLNPADSPKEFARSLRKLLVSNGYPSKVPLRFEGSPPVHSFPTFIDYLTPEAVPRKRAVQRSGSAEGRGKIDWILYEMALYGVTKALDDQLGQQAQLILRKMGTEILDYLVKLGKVQLSDDPEATFNSLKSFYLTGGYAEYGDFDIEGSPPRALVAKWTNSPYYSDVLRRLQKEGSSLFSCPICLAGESILFKTRGFRFQDLVELKFLPGARVYYRHKILPPVESFTEKDAERISKMTP